jgi:geranylgeranyl diphosphate synthase type I
MSLNSLIKEYRGSIEDELHHVVDLIDEPELAGLKQIIAYHLGWEGEGADMVVRGGRIRPLLLLLTTASAEGEWQRALPAAAAVELLHNFSLIHDDIMDNSPIRRGRPAVWTKWGVPHGINVGDTICSLANLALIELGKTTSSAIMSVAHYTLQKAYLHLTEGQYLDLDFEKRGSLSLDGYWAMVRCNTAALISASTEIGALVAEAPKKRTAAYSEFGSYLALAFQAIDDLLGIWGEAALTGKSSESDLTTGKKSLPILYGLSLNGPFANRFAKGPIHPGEVPGIADQLEKEGVRKFVSETANRLIDQALEKLYDANPTGEAGEALVELTHKLLVKRV